MSDLVEIGGLWKNEGKDGEYFSGKLGQAKLLIFANKYKKTDKHPDFRMYVTKVEKKEESDF